MHKVDTTQNLTAVADKYTVRTTDYVDSISAHPAIARQYMPDMRELDKTADEVNDPIGDYPHTPVKGIVHRYPDRVLLKPHHACAVYCRFCFRRDMVGRNGEALTAKDLERAFEYIASHKEIWEVILTGGDPMALSVRRLQNIIHKLNTIQHVEMIRIHTRVPVAAPEMVTAEMCEIIKSSDKPVTISVHCNHARELAQPAVNALKSLHQAGAMLVSQSVLLKGVNDDVKTLEQLFRALSVNRVKPYYLHHPDKAEGTAHFRLSLKRGLDIYEQLRGRLSGICIPHYMLDIPGGHGKVAIDSSRVQIKENHAEVTDPKGVVHIYKD